MRKFNLLSLILSAILIWSISLSPVAPVPLESPAVADVLYMKQSTPGPIPFQMVDLSTKYNPVTGIAASIVVKLRLLENGVGTWTTGAGTVQEEDATNAPGQYRYTPTAGELATCGKLAFRFTCTSPACAYYPITVQVWAVDPTDAIAFGMSRLDTNVNSRQSGSSAIFALPAVNSGVLRTGTAQAAGSSTITLDSGSVATDDYYKGAPVTIITGTGALQSSRTIIGYVGSTRVATLDRPWITIPDNTSVFVVDKISGERLDTNLAITAGTVSDKSGFSLTGTQSFNNSGQTTKQPVTLSAVDVTGNVPAVVNAYAAGQEPETRTLGAVASSYNVSGTIGNKINAAGSAGDPLATLVPGSYGTGTAGWIIGTYINAAISNLKTVTDKLATMLATSGSNYTYTVDALKNGPSGGGGGGGGSTVVQLVRGPLVLKSGTKISEAGFTSDTLPLLLQCVDSNGSILAITGATITASVSQFGSVVTSGISTSSTDTVSNTFKMMIPLPSVAGVAKLTVTRTAGSDVQTFSIDITVKAR